VSFGIVIQDGNAPPGIVDRLLYFYLRRAYQVRG